MQSKTSLVYLRAREGSIIAHNLRRNIAWLMKNEPRYKGSGYWTQSPRGEHAGDGKNCPKCIADAKKHLRS